MVRAYVYIEKSEYPPNTRAYALFPCPLKRFCHEVVSTKFLTPSRKRLRAKYTPDLHLTYSKTTGIQGLK